LPIALENEVALILDIIIEGRPSNPDAAGDIAKRDLPHAASIQLRGRFIQQRTAAVTARIFGRCACSALVALHFTSPTPTAFPKTTLADPT
jgi:hypothetical protein